ncbi:MAG: cation:proton antiporter [Saprospiraceae bacterium]
MDFSSPYTLIIISSIVLILSFVFGEVSKRTSIPAVLMLIVLGVFMKLGMDAIGTGNIDFFPILELLGIVGLIMIVLEAALELKLERNKLVPISMAFGIALLGLLLSTWLTAEVLNYFIDFCEGGECHDAKWKAWIYATPLSILSSAIIIPSVTNLRSDKKEFHIYESTFSDILGIMLFYFLTSQVSASGETSHGGGFLSFGISTLLTIVISFIASYILVLVFQKIESHVKLFLLIATLLLLYAIGKKLHLSSLIIILIFGLLIANMDLFFIGPLKKWLDKKKAHEIYHGLHVITMETAFVVRTFFFVIFGITIVFSDLASWSVVGISLICLALIYIVRFVLLRGTLGNDLVPQLYIAPRGLITILLFYAIPEFMRIEAFSPGILLFIILGSSVIMTVSLIINKKRNNKAISNVLALDISETKWKVPEMNNKYGK